MSRSESEPETQVISVSTILILSGVIIGLTIQRFVGEETAPYLLAAGLSGFLAFLALDLASARRGRAALKAEQVQMEDRLDKHTHSLTSIGFTLEPISNGEMDATETAPQVEAEPAASEENDHVVASA